MNVGIIQTGQNNIDAWKNILFEKGIEGYEINSKKSFQENRHDLIIMPGVGSFDSGVRSLKQKNIFDDIKRWGNDNNPILGVCLGFQLMFDGSEEGSESGLSFVDGLCRRFNGDTPVPRMEWGEINWIESERFHSDFNNERYFFVHSYYAPRNKFEIAVSNYQQNYCVGIKKGNIIGFQFHPEKSHVFGNNLLDKILSYYGA